MPHPASPFWSARTRFFCGCLFLLLLFGRDRLLRDPGTLWHTIVGDQILSSGHVPHHDPFSFTQSGGDWIAQQWLGEVLMSIIHRFAGLDGLVLLAVAIIAWTLASIANRLLRAGLHWLPAALLIGLVAAASSYHYIPRPHLITIALMAWLQFLVCDVEAGRRRPAALLLIPLIMILWTNIHGGALGGLLTLLATCFGWLILPTFQRKLGLLEFPPIPRSIIAAAAGLSILAILINPYGSALPAAWLSLMGIDLLPHVILEHAPLKILSPEGAMILLLAIVYLLLLIASRRQALRITWLIPLLWLALAFTRVRHGPLFAVTAAAAIADMLRQPAIRARIAAFTTNQHAVEPNRHNPLGRSFNPATSHGLQSVRPFDHRLSARFLSAGRAALVPIAILALGLGLQSAGIPCPLLGAGWCRLHPDHWPIAAANVLNSQITQHHDEKPVRVFNDMRFGGYLIYTLPQTRVFIDDRCELYREAGIRNYLDIRAHPEHIEGAALQESIDWALVQSGTRLDDYLARSPSWQPRHHDPTAALYQRSPSWSARSP